MVWMCQIVIEILWSQSNGGDMLDGEQFFSITIQHIPTV
jgi:hypothetical protein